MCPKSVAILRRLFPLWILKPQGCAAAWGVLNGWRVKALRLKSLSFSNVLILFSSYFFSIPSLIVLFIYSIFTYLEKDKFSLARRTPFEEDKLKDEDNKTNSIWRTKHILS